MGRPVELPRLDPSGETGARYAVRDQIRRLRVPAVEEAHCAAAVGLLRPLADALSGVVGPLVKRGRPWSEILVAVEDELIARGEDRRAESLRFQAANPPEWLRPVDENVNGAWAP